MERKNEIRQILLKRRKALNERERSIRDKAILGKVLSLSEFAGSDTILIYASYNGEVDTYGLIEESLKAGKRVACPRCRIDNDIPLLDFYYIESTDELTEGYKGIPEPSDSACKLTDRDMEGALLILPMVGYDKELNRLGYGKGFYDRFLNGHMGLKKVGLAYSCQEYPGIPVDEYDVRPDMVINEL